MRSLTLAAAIILSSGCSWFTPRVEYIPVELPLPPEITLPTIPAEDLECLPDAAYEALVKRDQLQTERRRMLREIIRSTHP